MCVFRRHMHNYVIHVFSDRYQYYRCTLAKVFIFVKYLSMSTDLAYNCALCYYMLKQYAPSLKHIAEIIEKGIKEHPGMHVCVVNTCTLNKVLKSYIF